MPPKRKAALTRKATNNESSSESELDEIQVGRKGKTQKRKQKDTDSDDPDQPAKSRKKPKETKPTKTLLNETSTNYSDITFDCQTKNEKGETPNFKIANWNVDGLRAWLKKDGISYISKENPDILCLQETKCSESKLPEEVKSLDGYEVFWLGSQKEGYAGVGLLSKKKPIEVTFGIKKPEHDDEGRCITAEYEKFFVISVYVPNAGRGLVTLPKRLKWNEDFKKYIKSLDEKKPVIICGDLNVAHEEIDLANPKTNKKNAGFTVEEREGMTDFLADGYVDTFRHFYPDRKDAYTFWSYMSKARAKNVGWRLDYFLVSSRMMEMVCDNVIRSQVFGSDHCPIVLFMHV